MLGGKPDRKIAVGISKNEFLDEMSQLTGWNRVQDGTKNEPEISIV
jgi:hypothetical protein